LKPPEGETLKPLKTPLYGWSILLEDNRTFHNTLEKLGYPHEYEEFPGAHDWGYWDVHVQKAIAFHARNLKLQRKIKVDLL